MKMKLVRAVFCMSVATEKVLGGNKPARYAIYYFATQNELQAE